MSATGEIELVYLDDCPHWREADVRVREAMLAAGLDPASVRYRGVGGHDAPPRFPGSPTVLIGGHDAFPTTSPLGPTCRLYETEVGVQGAPSLDQLVEVLTRAARTEGADD